MHAPPPTHVPPRTDRPPARRRLPVLLVALATALAATVIPASAVADDLPEFRYRTTLLDGASFSGGGLQQPTIIRASDHFDDPLGEYYLYFGTQNEGGIGLAYGDSLDGPFTEYAGNPVVRSVSGPHAVFDEDAGRLDLYLHGTRSVAVARSSDGLSFSSPTALFTGDAVEGVSRFQLPRVFEHTVPSIGDRWTMLVMGIDAGTRKIFRATSDDGNAWDVHPEPVVSPGPEEGGQIASPHLLEIDGETHVAYHAASGAIHLTRVGADFDVEEHLGVLHAPMDRGPDDGRVAAPAFFEQDGTLQMAYEAGPAGSSAIALAAADGLPDAEEPDGPPVPDRPALPEFHHRGVAIDPDDLTHFEPTGEVIFPSIVRAADHVDEPLATYYLYYAPHENPGGISVAYSDSLDGPWEEYAGNPLVPARWEPHHDVSHVSSPHVLWNEAEERFFLYYHGENDTTRLATSPDGLDFTYDSVVLTTADIPGNSEASYARVFEHTLPSVGNTYTMLLMGNERGTRKIWFATSDDGRNWEARTSPLISPSTGQGGQLSGPWLFPWDDRVFVVHHSGAGTMHLTEVGEDLDLEHHLGVFYESSTGLRSAAPSFITEGDTMYLFYELGHRLNAKIAWATADISAWIDEPGDDVPPEVTCVADPAVLWPPNGALHDVTVDVTVADEGSGPAGFTLEHVEVDEIAGGGDVVGFEPGTDAVTGQLRATRDGGGSGRTYALTYVGADQAGDSTSCTATVTVPHDRRG